MATSVKYPTANTAATSYDGTATNPTDAYTDDTAYASFVNIGRNKEYAHLWGGFDFSAIPAGSTINSVTVKINEYVGTSWSQGTWRAALYPDITATVATERGDTGAINTPVERGTTDTSDFLWDLGTLSTEPTLTQLQGTNFGIKIEVEKGNNGTLYTAYIDYIEITVDYTLAANDYDETGRTVSGAGTATATSLAKFLAAALISVVATASIGSEVYTPSATNYDETGRSVAASATVTATDQADFVDALASSGAGTITIPTETYTDNPIEYDETGRSVSIAATIDVTDDYTHIVDYTGFHLRKLAGGSTLRGGDTLRGAATAGPQEYDETGRLVSGAGTVTVSDQADYLGDVAVAGAGTITVVEVVGQTEDTSVAGAGTVTATDQADFLDDTSVTVAGTVTPTDEYTDNPIPYDETGRSVTATGTVTATDQFDAIDDVSVSGAGTVTATEEKGYTEDRPVEAAGTVDVTDRADFLEDTLVSVAATITPTDQQDSPGAYDETGRLVEAAGTVTVTDQADLIDATSVSIAATITPTDDYTDNPIPYDETGRSVSGAGTVSVTDQFDALDDVSVSAAGTVTATDERGLTEDVSVAPAATVTATGRLDAVETLSVSAAGTVDVTDQQDSPGAYDETGRQVTAAGTITVTDQADFVDDVAVSGTATVDETDDYTLAPIASFRLRKAAGGSTLRGDYFVKGGTGFSGYNETGRLVSVTATATVTDRIDVIDDVAVSVAATVTATDDDNTEDVLVSVVATVSATDYYTISGTLLWSDGFESGDFSEWLPAISGDASATIDTGTVHSGTYSAKLANWNMDTPTSAGARITPANYDWWSCSTPMPDDAYYSVWYYIPFAYEGQSNVFQMKQSKKLTETTHTWAMIWKISFIWDAIEEMYSMQMATRVNQTDGAWYDTVLVQDETDPIVPVGEWFHLETRYVWGQDNTGSTTIWLNGVQVYDQQAMSTEANNFECLKWPRTWAVNHYLGDWQGPVTPADSWMFVDDAKVSTVRVGSASYDETGRSVSAAATVTFTHQIGHLEHTTVSAAGTITATDAAGYTEDTSVSAVATVDETDDYTPSLWEENVVVSIVATVTVTDAGGADPENTSVSIVCTVTGFDDMWSLHARATGRGLTDDGQAPGRTDDGGDTGITVDETSPGTSHDLHLIGTTV